MSQSSRKLPLERRRESRNEATRAPFLPPGRRESDLARMRMQHWMDLAEIALTQDRYAKAPAEEQAPDPEERNKAA